MAAQENGGGYADLIREAQSARDSAYAPYSRFSVGAALKTKSGAVYRGCNVENISFGLTICAERVCVGAAIVSNDHDFEVIAIVSDSGDPVVPCGACRQVLAEFSPGMTIVTANLSGAVSKFNLNELLPRPSQGILG